MRRFCPRGPGIFQSFIFVMISILLPQSARAVTVGLHAGNFDPPTSERMAVVRCALGDASAHKECPEIANTIGRVIVVVNQADGEDPLASVRERVVMVRKLIIEMYAPYAGVVQISSAPLRAVLALLGQ